MTARHALLRLLSAAPDLNLFERDTVGQADCRAPLLDLFVAAFLREASRQAALGLIQSAVADEESLTALRGRFLAGENVRRNTVRPDRLHCRFDDLTVDNPLNRYVRAAIERSQRMITRSATHRLWMETRARYDRVSAMPLGIKDSPSKRLTRSTRRYSRLLSWADRILSMSTPSLSSGGDAASGLLFDMQKLFEHAVYLRCIKEAGAKESVSRPRGNLPLARHKSGSEHFGLRPDVVITGASTEQISRIVDAKWKWIDTRKHDLDVSSHDIHQVATYAMRYGCTDVCLIYPAVDGRDANESKKTFRVTLGGTMHSSSLEILISIRTISVFL
jgi:5-methylcytosine-specific restriction enzyme subunit McrC